MKSLTAMPASRATYELGEGPVWDAERKRVLWVDINAGHVHVGSFDGGRVLSLERLDFDETVGAVVSSAAGELLVAGRRRVYYLDPKGVRRTAIQVIRDGKASRFNDGSCDPAGRFLVGTLTTNGTQGAEVLFRIEDKIATVIDDDLTLSNGLAWAPDGRTMYNVDTTPGIVWRRSYDPAGVTGPRTEFLRITDGGRPDGLCSDVEGNLWIAIWGAGQVRCYSPTGNRLATVEVPAPHTSSVAFVGPSLDTLLITTAFESLSAEQLARYPDSGRLFTAQVETRGLSVAAWSGH